MRPVVYIDVLFILNFLIDFILLYTTSFVCKSGAKLWRLTLGAVIGAVYSCLMFFPRVALLMTIAGKLLFTAGMVAVSLNCWKPRRFFRAYAVFWIVSAAFGGMVFALFFLTNAGARLGAVVSNGEFYMQIGAEMLFTAVLLSYAGVFAFTRLCRRNFSKDKIILPLRLTLGSRSVKIRALIDTGCELCDPLDGRPVMIAWQGAVERLFSKETKQQLSQYRRAEEQKISPAEIEWSFDGIRFLPFSSVGTVQGLLPSVRLDSVQDMSGKYRLENDCFMGILSFPLSEEGIYDAVLNPDILIQEFNTQMGVTANVQKISDPVPDKVVSVEVSPRIASSQKGTLYWGRRSSSAAPVERGSGRIDCVACAGGECRGDTPDFD